MINPIRNDPVQLITNVPYGNRVPIRSLIYPPSQNRAMEPKNPPMPTIRYLFIVVNSISLQSFNHSFVDQRFQSSSLCATVTLVGLCMRIRIFRHSRLNTAAALQRKLTPQHPAHQFTLFVIRAIVAVDMTPRQDPCQESSSVPAYEGQRL